MEEIFSSECSSGCESGWTLYLEHSMYHTSQSLQYHNNGDYCKSKKSSFTHEEEEEEEDMSMVSDASSGPQHVQEQEDERNSFKFSNNGGVGGVCINGNKQKTPKEPIFHKKIQDLPSFLDDTASSPLFSLSNNNLTVSSKKASMEENNIIDYSQGYSTTYFEGKSRFQDQFGFFHPSVSGTQLQENQWFEGKRWG